jgi:hypothetical protein
VDAAMVLGFKVVIKADAVMIVGSELIEVNPIMALGSGMAVKVGVTSMMLLNIFISLEDAEVCI